ncbi:FadR/GntR family transcriptional regulator [Piscinibacter koreensis]|uniref:FadR family transcriptional regulator n=1 Tax=Piscinibacter koreensis TaxID=2742824 RepID=A0A7Y6NMX8_9BURK|nr:FCD domain-containing protein [Schlegelella koreensis]NUZ06105.1 FadR family transcriptional regulator [Schlegelella koreensis]
MNDSTAPARTDARSLSDEASVRTPRIFEAICEQVRSQLSMGRLKPGDKLPAERELAVQFGSSRTAVREALRSLEIAGVIELRKGVKGGAFIREGDPAVVTRSFGDMVHLGRISLENLTESRVIIQDAVIRLACERGSDADFDALEESIARTERLTREKRWDERRVQLVSFYRVLAQATQNEVMVIMVDALTDIVLQVIARDSAVPKEDTVKVQRQIVECLRRRDADAAAALMSRHLKALHGHLFDAASQRSRALRARRSANAQAPVGKTSARAAGAGRGASAAPRNAAAGSGPAPRRPAASPASAARKGAGNGTGASRKTSGNGSSVASRKTAGASETASRKSATGATGAVRKGAANGSTAARKGAAAPARRAAPGAGAKVAAKGRSSAKKAAAGAKSTRGTARRR